MARKSAARAIKHPCPCPLLAQMRHPVTPPGTAAKSQNGRSKLIITVHAYPFCVNQWSARYPTRCPEAFAFAEFRQLGSAQPQSVAPPPSWCSDLDAQRPIGPSAAPQDKAPPRDWAPSPAKRAVPWPAQTAAGDHAPSLQWCLPEHQCWLQRRAAIIQPFA